MGRLHEVLAVEGDLEATAKKVVKEATDTFTKKHEHFSELIRTLSMFDDARVKENSVETKTMVTTVSDKLKYVAGKVGKYWDATAQKDFANTQAVADLVVDDVVLLKASPATFLLSLENKLKGLRSMYEGIPTLQPGRKWVLDADRGEGWFHNDEVETRLRTEKQIQAKIVAEATKEHKAQVETWTADTPIGEYKVEQWSGCLSTADKSELLTRVDNLIRGCKKARQRANRVEAPNLHIGEVLFKYLHG